jgi:protein O-GlcNAc transferase
VANIDHVIRTARAHAQAGRLLQAKSLLQRALAGDPAQADLNNAMANVLLFSGELARAAYFAQCAVRARPDKGMLHATLGNALSATMDIPGAEVAYRRAIELDPANGSAFLGLTNLLEARLRYEDALDTVRAGMAAAPMDASMAAACSNILVNCGRAGEAVEQGRRSMEKFGASSAAMLLLSQAQCFAFNYVDGADPGEVFAEHVRYGRLLAATIGGPAPARGQAGRAPREGPQRVGFISPDFRAHPVAYFAEPIIEHVDRARFEVYCYSTGLKADPTTARIKSKADAWRDAARLDDASLAARISQDKIDLLIELSGHTRGHRLGVLARRPAPVQATAIGYPNTTGVAAIDYRIVDAATDPPGAESLATERLARVPGCFLCYRPPEKRPEVTPPPSSVAGHITFGSLNALPKFTPTVIGMWTRVVLETPGSRLLLKNKQLADPRAQERWRGLFEAAGLPVHRLEMIGYSPPHEHMAFYARVDIGLDTYPYHGTTTTCEALWMGVPTVTLCGKVHAARVGASLLGVIGLGELVARTPDEFVRTATRLAQDPARLASLRAGMRDRMTGTPLCDPTAYARRIADVYERMLSGAKAPR